MEIKRLLLIYNPRSGRGAITTFLPEILKTFDGAGYLTTIYKTKAEGDANVIAEQIGAEYDRIVVAGGDGTLNGVINGLMRLPREKRPQVGFIPAGSTNDTRSSYHLPANIPYAARTATTGTPFATDIGKCNDKYFTYVASLGELSAVSCFTPQVAKNVFGHAAYLSEGLKALLKMQSHVIKVTYDDEETIEGDYFLGMVTNALSVGGFQGITGNNVDLQDGLFEVMLIKKPADLAEFNAEIETVLLASKNGLTNGPTIADNLVLKFKANHIKFESEDNIQWVVDGEDGGRHQVAEITNYNKAITLISGKA